MRGNLLVLLAFITIGYTACKQTAYKVPPPAPATSYFPQTIGSTWQYRDSVYGLATDTFPLKGVKNDIVNYTINKHTTDFNGIVCYDADVQSQLYGAGTAYFGVLQHHEYLLVSSPPWGLMALQVLIDNASVGDTWHGYPALYGSLNGSPVQTINTILEQNITRVVNGVTFTSVTHTGVNFQINLNNSGFHNIAYFDFYLAQGVGLIEKDASYYGLLNETETILNYKIQ